MQDTQISQAMDAQSHEKTPMDIDESDGKEFKEGESENLKLQNAIIKRALTTGMSNQSASATEIGNQQAHTEGMNYQQATAIGMNNQQANAMGMNNQQAVPTGMSSQQATAMGKNNQQIVPTGMNNQKETATGMGNHQPQTTMVSSQQLTGPGISIQQQARPSMSHQQSTISGLVNQQSVAMGSNNQQSMAMATNNHHSAAGGTSHQQSVPVGMSNQPPTATGMSNQQTAAAGTSNQEALAGQQAINLLNRGKQVPFALLLPVIQPLLDRDRSMQLQSVYLKLKKNEITKEAFVRHMRTLVGDQMLKMAVYKLQQQAARNSQTVPNQQPVPAHASLQQHMQVPSNVQRPTELSNLTTDNNSLQPLEVASQGESLNSQATQMTSSNLNASSLERERPAFPVQGLNTQQQQQHLHFSQSSFPTFGSTGNSHHLYTTSNVTTSAASLKQQAHDSQMRQLPAHQNMSGSQLGSSSQSMNMMNAPKAERQNSFGDPKRMQGVTVPHLANNSTLQSVQWNSSNIKEHRNGVPSSMPYVKQEPVDQSNDQQQRSQLSTSQGLSSFPTVNGERGNSNSGTSKEDAFEMHSSRQRFSTSTSSVPSSAASMMSSQMDHNHMLNSRISSAPSPITAANNTKAPIKKPSVGQKKPMDALGSSPPPSSKKQKVTGALLDQSIEQLNDVTAVSGVNLREEEEQLFSGTKEDSRVSEASRRVVQEEEERLILQKIPLRKKLAEIMAKCGLKTIGSDVEKCLSLCVEERMRGLMTNLIRLSKQRADIEKPRHRTIITSDVRQKVMAINREVHEEWEKKQAEAEKLQKLNEPEENTAEDAEKDKDDTRSRPVKVANKEEDDKMRTTAANVAARAAVGGDDMLSKWQLMAEQARQKREGGADASSGSQAGKDAARKPLSTTGRGVRDHQEVERRGHSAAAPGSVRKTGRNEITAPQNRVARTITVRDVIAVLEREPQMSKSTLLYRLYEKGRSEGSSE